MTEKIYAGQTVSVSELRKRPADFFQDAPIAVLSNNKTAGYTVGKEYFERLMQIVETSKLNHNAQFTPTAKRLQEIVSEVPSILANLSEDDLDDFKEM